MNRITHLHSNHSFRDVALDHTRLLGSTVEEIGRRKAGIFKANVDALVGPQVPMAVMGVSVFAN